MPNEFDELDDILSAADEFDNLSEWEQQEIEQREIFSDRYDAWRNEY